MKFYHEKIMKWYHSKLARFKKILKRTNRSYKFFRVFQFRDLLKFCVEKVKNPWLFPYAWNLTVKSLQIDFFWSAF